jgi:hypothetical protein
LMDQSVIAGIGNIYADEILFHARCIPRHGSMCSTTRPSLAFTTRCATCSRSRSHAERAQKSSSIACRAVICCLIAKRAVSALDAALRLRTSSLAPEHPGSVLDASRRPNERASPAPALPRRAPARALPPQQRRQLGPGPGVDDVVRA